MDIIMLFFYMTEHNYSVFCNQKRGSTKNVNANLSGYLNGVNVTYFFHARFARSVFKTLIKFIVQSGTSTNPYITYLLLCLLVKTAAFYYMLTYNIFR